jgi:hypothetical protein
MMGTVLKIVLFIIANIVMAKLILSIHFWLDRKYGKYRSKC